MCITIIGILFQKYLFYIFTLSFFHLFYIHNLLNILNLLKVINRIYRQYVTDPQTNKSKMEASFVTTIVSSGPFRKFLYFWLDNGCFTILLIFHWVPWALLNLNDAKNIKDSRCFTISSERVSSLTLKGSIIFMFPEREAE